MIFAVMPCGPLVRECAAVLRKLLAKKQAAQKRLAASGVGDAGRNLI
jgi:hypothetical protein